MQEKIGHSIPGHVMATTIKGFAAHHFGVAISFKTQEEIDGGTLKEMIELQIPFSIQRKQEEGAPLYTPKEKQGPFLFQDSKFTSYEEVEKFADLFSDRFGDKVYGSHNQPEVDAAELKRDVELILEEVRG